MRMHGGNIFQSPKMLDFSANINPLGMPETVRDAVMHAAAECAHYPDPHCTDLIHALSAYEQIPGSRIVCGNGAADLIYRIVHAFRPRKALLPAPTFSEYAFALNETGCAVSEYPLHAENSFRLDEAFLFAISDNTDIVFLCSPNNPTGQLTAPELLCAVAEKCRKQSTLLVCDECFLRFAEHAEQYSLRRYFHESCVILHAFTKLYAMPGLRLGYALCGSDAIAEKLRQSGQFWSVSVPAQAAGIAALQAPDRIPETVRYVSAERAFLSDALRDSGIFVYDGAANFLLVKAASDFAARMKTHGIMVRTCTDFYGLSDRHFRIAVRTHEENLALIAAVREEYK